MNTLPSYLSFESNLDLEADYLIPYTIKAEIGKVESGLIALEELSKYGYIQDDSITEMFYINQESYVSKEGLGTVIKQIVEAIKKCIAKIAEWFRGMWAKINVFLVNIFKYIDKVADEFRYLRNKSELVLSSSLVQDFKDLFPFADIKNPVTAILPSLSCLSNFEKLAADVVKSGHVFKSEKYVVYDNGQVESFFFRPDNGAGVTQLTFISKQDKRKSGDEPKYATDKPMTTSFDPWLTFAVELDKARFSINKISSSIKKASDSCNVLAEAIEKNPDTVPNSTDVLKNILLLQNKGALAVTFNYIDIIRKATKFLKKVAKSAEETSAEGYKMFLKAYANSKDLQTKLELGAPSTLSVVDKGEILYISAKDPGGLTTLSGGAFAFPHFKFQVLNTAQSDVEKQHQEAFEKGLSEASIDIGNGVDVRSLNLIFINEDLVQALVDNLGGGMTLKFAYWHEVGHVVTNQQEITYKIDTNNPEDVFLNAVLKYIRHRSENQADAFACLKTGVSPEGAWETRVKVFAKIVAHPASYAANANKTGLFNGTAGAQNKHQQFAMDFKGKEEAYKQEYIRNVTREMQVMRKYTKLGFRGWLRSVMA